MTEEDKDDLLTAAVMLFPWVFLLVLGVIAGIILPSNKNHKSYIIEKEALDNIINQAKVYQFEWPEGNIEYYTKEDIKGLSYYPEANCIEFTTSKLEKDGWGSKNETISIFGLDNIKVSEEGTVFIKAGQR